MDPRVSWWITILSFSICLFLGCAIVATKPNEADHLPVFAMGELLFFSCGLQGLQYIKMRIRVDGTSLVIRGLVRSRTVLLDDIGSVKDTITGRYRTLDVHDRRGKRVLRVTSSFLTDYGGLVSLIKAGSDKHPGGATPVAAANQPRHW
jgi:hypothetical protein